MIGSMPRGGILSAAIFPVANPRPAKSRGCKLSDARPAVAAIFWGLLIGLISRGGTVT